MLYNTKNMSENTIHKHQEVIWLDMRHPAMASLVEFGITVCGYARTVPPFTLTRLGHIEEEHFDICLVIKGKKLLETETEDIVINEGDFYYIPSRVSRRLSSIDNSDCLCIFMRIFGKADSFLKLDEIMVRPSVEINHINNSFHKINEEFDNNSSNSDKIIKLHSELISLYLLNEFKFPNSPAEMERILAFRKLWDMVKENPSKNWTVERMANIMYTSQSNFLILCKKHQNITPFKKITAIRMLLAENMLKNTNFNLDKIAGEVGYADEFTFSKAFKKQYTVSPGKYRKNAVDII